MKRITASDRSALIKLAASLPSGSSERTAILVGLQSHKTASEDVVAIVDVNGHKYDFTKSDISEMLDPNGQVNSRYRSADNLPRWLESAGWKTLTYYKGRFLNRRVPNPSAKNFGGGWRSGNEGWTRVAEILGSLLNADRPAHFVLGDFNRDDGRAMMRLP